MTRPRLIQAPVAVAAVLFCTAYASAHEGRRFFVEVVDGKLQAQGVNTGTLINEDAVRSYPNAIHDHWMNFLVFTPDPTPLASTTLPDFAIPAEAVLAGLGDQRLTLTLTGAKKWVDPPTSMPPPGTAPTLSPLDPGEVISVSRLDGGGGLLETVTTDAPGGLTLNAAVPPRGVDDIPISYLIDGNPASEIHVLEFVLSATPPNPQSPQLEASDPIYVLLSPDGADPATRLHHASLFLEEYLATRAPEPSAAVLLLALVCTALLRRRSDERRSSVVC